MDITLSLCFLFSFSLVRASGDVKSENAAAIDCSTLRLGQYICPDPNWGDQIDPDTQQFIGCVMGKEIPSNGEAAVKCIAANEIVCDEFNNATFTRKVPCKWTEWLPTRWKDDLTKVAGSCWVQSPQDWLLWKCMDQYLAVVGWNGYSLEIALLLSVFLGMFGLDRFYLGYPGIGLAKLCTLGFMFLGQLLDIILIAAQVVGPSDGSAYVIPYYGAGVSVVRSDNETYLLPQPDWHNIT